MTTAPSMYRRILGDQYQSLPPVLVQFHGEPRVKLARGTFDIRRGRGWLRRLVASLSGLPREGSNVPLDLRIEPVGDGERWIRRFGNSELATLQHNPSPHIMIERVGALTVTAYLTVENSRLLFQFRRAKLLGIPMPRWFTVRVNGYAEGDDKQWTVDVQIAAPWLGMIAHYHGEVRPC